MVIFRENTEDIYAGIEFADGTDDVKKVLAFLKETFPSAYKKVRFPDIVGDRLQAGVARGQRAADSRRDRVRASRTSAKSVTLVHKGNIMKFTEGAFRNWGYALAEREFGERRSTTSEQWEKTRTAPRRGRRERRTEGRRSPPARCSSRMPSPTSRCSRC